MAKALDLEEQEQLDQLKHFWNRYGNFITWVAIIVFGSIAAWNAWNFWQAKQAAAASVLYEEVEKAVAKKDLERIERSFNDLKNQYGRTTYAQQGALLAAKGLYASGDATKAKLGLEWAVTQGADPALQAIARLRLSALALEQKDTDSAAKWLAGDMPLEFDALAADRRGDIHLIKGEKDEAKKSYLYAHSKMGDDMEYRRLVEVKLNALGVDLTATSSVSK